MKWTISQTRDVETCQALRRTVFIEEQNVSEADEVDGRDGEAVHVLAIKDGRPVGCARILFMDEVAKIGRVCVLKDMRHHGLGAAIVNSCLDIARAQPGTTTAKLGAQTHAQMFYGKLGFEAIGPVYHDAGIPHRDMVRAL